MVDAVRSAEAPARTREPSRPSARRAGAGPRPRRRAVSRVVLSTVVMAFAAAVVATVGLPSYAFDPTRPADASGPTLSATGQQRFAAGSDVDAAELHRDAFSATSAEELKRRAYAQQFSAYTGPTADDYLKQYGAGAAVAGKTAVKDPGAPSFSLDAVLATAEQYQGVPYVFGGADPSGFDCSGFVMFVYAQYGIALPHSVHQQDAIGTTISAADARPGDVIVFNDDSHDGFYAGNGMILHAPYPGARVRIQPLWSSNVHYVRFGV